MKVAIVYDRVNKWGGAERVLLTLHKIFPKAPLYTSVYDKKNASWANIFHVKTSFLQYVPFAKSHHEFFAPLMPFAFALFSFKEYDLVISVTSEYAKGVITTGKTKHLCLCLTPTRYLWSGYHHYFHNKIFRQVTHPLVFLLRKWDTYIASLPDQYIAISQEVQKRIQKYYHRKSVVIYPAVTKLPKPENTNLFEKNYFLVVSRLSRFTSYKRVDLAVAAATKLGASLIVVGNGDSSYLKEIAGPTIQFMQKTTDAELARLYANCKALIFPGREDFGLTMVEALSFGKPVIAYKAGGALEIVKPGKTGTFFKSQTESSLVKALKSFREDSYNSSICRKQALRFVEKIFQREIKKVVKSLVKNKI